MGSANASGMTLAQFNTFLNATDEDFIPNKLRMTLNYPKYEVVNNILPEHKKLASGTSYQTHIQLEDSPNGGHTGMAFATDQTTIFDTDQTVTSNYRHYVNSMAYDKALMDLNRGDRVQRYDYIKSQRMAMYRKTGDDMQESFWSAPASASDTTSPIGPFGWLVQGTDGDTGSFSGGDPYYLDGNTYSAGTLATGTYSKWKNWYADHNGVLDATILDTLASAHLDTDFEGPMLPGMRVEGVETTAPMKAQMYTSKAMLLAIEKVARNSDDRVGYDLGKYAGKTVYKGIPFNHVKIFDTASTYLYGTNPIVGINWNVLYPVVVRGWDFVRATRQNPFSHNAFDEFIDLYWAGCHCEDRRSAGFLISQQ